MTIMWHFMGKEIKMEILPEQIILHHITPHLEGRDLIALSRTCKKLHGICSDQNEEFWAELLEEKYGHLDFDIPPDVSSTQYYFSVLEELDARKLETYVLNLLKQLETKEPKEQKAYRLYGDIIFVANNKVEALLKMDKYYGDIIYYEICSGDYLYTPHSIYEIVDDILWNFYDEGNLYGIKVYDLI